MIAYEEAIKLVLETATDLGTEMVPLKKSVHRMLAEDVFADRPLPPFHRVTKDGIAVCFDALQAGSNTLPIADVIAAGDEKYTLENPETCVEIMTGAVLPNGADTVIMYEEITIVDNVATFQKPVQKGINIHEKGSDRVEGSLVLNKNCRITGKELGILASVGSDMVPVKKLPKVAVISTGNELVNVYQKPKPHQIRKSNSFSLLGALASVGIIPELHHLKDDKETLRTQLKTLVTSKDVLLISGGVSKGKFDFIPEILEELGVEKAFHRVAQQPGKPLWFGMQKSEQTFVFSFPGNPVSTYVNYHVYFLPWLYKSLEVASTESQVFIQNDLQAHPVLTRYLLVKTWIAQGKYYAALIGNNGSGDFASLALADGVVVVPPETAVTKEMLLRYIKL